MTARPDYAPAETMFLPGRAGALYARYQPASAAARHREDLLIAPAFAEEMNKSRRMCALLAQRLAALGIGTAIVDLYGTGDSEGDFADARYDVWLDDLATVLRWLRERNAKPVGLLGLRFGALLAADVVRRGAGAIERLILWQPVPSGEALITQFLRLRVAAQMLSSAEAKETTAALRDRLRAGEPIEVAGYTLTPALVEAIDALRLEALATSSFPPATWLELGTDELSPASRRVVEAWRNRGVDVATNVVAGPAFWSAVEIATAPALIDYTVAPFAGKAVA